MNNQCLVNCKEYLDNLFHRNSDLPPESTYQKAKQFLRYCILTPKEYDRWINYTVERLGL